MNNYMKIGDEAQSLLTEIANSENDAPVLTVCQIEELGVRAGIRADNIFVIAKQLETAGIVKINETGKELFLDKHHVEEFKRQSPAKQIV